ncbi:MAG: hypothetical protein SGI74_05640 [Oligoflexia bacterium]|nr:hypothetical protein [Oligoflexia bacterium]
MKYLTGFLGLTLAITLLYNGCGKGSVNTTQSSKKKPLPNRNRTSTSPTPSTTGGGWTTTGGGGTTTGGGTSGGGTTTGDSGGPPGPLPCQAPSMNECGAAEGPAGVYGCCVVQHSDYFTSAVQSAVDQIHIDRPDIFSDGYVTNHDAYMNGVVQILRNRGYCAVVGGPSDEIGIKTSNNINEQYDILKGEDIDEPWVGQAAVCRPARF